VLHPRELPLPDVRLRLPGLMRRHAARASVTG
jgi:hypothetical protein